MAKILTSTEGMERQAWLEARRKGIGGSDISAILGLNKWKSPIKLYMDKIGESPLEDNESEAARLGNLLEDIVAQEFSRRKGLKVKKRNAILQHEKYPYFLANVDRLIVGRKEGLECKTATVYKRDEWTADSVPDAYFVQCQWYMCVTGFKKWHLAALILGDVVNPWRFHEIERDDELIRIMEKKAAYFWNEHVSKRVPPPFDGSQSSKDLLDAMYPEQVEDSVDLPGYFDSKIEEYERTKEKINELTERKQAIENEIKGILGERKHGFVAGKKITWARFPVERFDKEKFKREHPDIYRQYVKEGHGSRFSIR
ncbi:YqaJ viral recombinase family protein [Bacillus haynesii]|uniref:YqaJ viral recombinase family nuclease n=1 Tax=Bacillus haynesii TaxID=1925021 RepID=UPI00227EE394|nr:YqaJ viral recombinase family protein [Bacillus haynesii]MCY9434190.1 YqaJ viral recombinase family protein [Bacillus haynesii]MEC0754626.1 YqaJ viral recombinase family protein [Bacillus haynesii]